MTENIDQETIQELKDQNRRLKATNAILSQRILDLKAEIRLTELQINTAWKQNQEIRGEKPTRRHLYKRVMGHKERIEAIKIARMMMKNDTNNRPRKQ